ncbi:hypothetical protein SEA_SCOOBYDOOBYDOO_89 [Mycobacterium phage ScoobyDoobyDoo]|nr:hypothetical protein SEA_SCOOBYDOOBYDOO_89 [Mycobacterium phage ScoobyDoobyDoo]
MQHVYTDDYGPGQIVESKTTRGRTEYRVAGLDGTWEVWMPATKVAFAPVDKSNSVDLPYDPAPQFAEGPLTESTIQPIHSIDADERTSPANSVTFEDRQRDEGDERGEPGPNPDLFAKSAAYGDPTTSEPGYSHGLEWDAPERSEYAHPDFQHFHEDEGYDEDPLAEAFASEDAAGDPGYGPDAQSWRSRGDQQYLGYRTADLLSTDAERTPFEPDYMEVNDTDDEYLRNEDVEADERETTGPDGIVHFAGRFVHANPAALAVPLARGLAQGLAGGAVERALNGGGGNGQDPNAGQGGGPASPLQDLGDQAKEQLTKENPLPLPDLGYGWNGLNVTHASYRPAGLDSRYADIQEALDPKIAAFRNDPEGFINRVGHVHSEDLSPDMAHYGSMVEADEMLRTAAWKDVRAKAMRLRREGRVHVKDVDVDRIYASVQGDHGTYDVMIKKGGAYGHGGAQSITNWHCACEWGKWAFQRRLTFVGRLCSHGYAAYQEMQSSHMRGKKRRPSTRRKAYDETSQDWKIKDTGDAKGALEDIRDWAEKPQEEDFGNMAERVEDIRDAVERAREEGVDADQLVASLRRQADLSDLNAVPVNQGGAQNLDYGNGPSGAAKGGLAPARTYYPEYGSGTQTPHTDDRATGVNEGAVAPPPPAAPAPPVPGGGADNSPATPTPGGGGSGSATDNAPAVDLSAVTPGGGSSGPTPGGSDTGDASAPGSSEPTTDNSPTVDEQQDTANPASTGADAMSSDVGGSAAAGAGGFDMSSIGDTIGGVTDAISSGVGLASDIGSAIGDVASSFSGILGSRELHSDPEWVKLAYPDGYHEHKPFNGSGGEQITDWGQSKDNVKENYSDNIEDVTEIPEKDHLTKDLEPERKKWRQSAKGITRAGSGPRQHVEPEVVRVRGAKQAVKAVEAEHVPFDDDPYSKTAADFGIGVPAQPESSMDIVAAFQAQAAAGGTALDGDAGKPSGGGAYDDFTSSPAFKKAMVRTAGRVYSPAEQEALIREGERGGAGNLDQLDLRGTHYEAENSIGLW